MTVYFIIVSLAAGFFVGGIFRGRRREYVDIYMGENGNLIIPAVAAKKIVDNADINGRHLVLTISKKKK